MLVCIKLQAVAVCHGHSANSDRALNNLWSCIAGTWCAVAFWADLDLFDNITYTTAGMSWADLWRLRCTAVTAVLRFRVCARVGFVSIRVE